jgi:imidazolonepropionase-like amidohydrolase
VETERAAAGNGPGTASNETAGTSGRGGAPQAAAPKSDGPLLAVTNARIHPITQGTIERGTIVIRGNRIEAVGADVKPPAGAKVIDAAGADIYPGFIDANTTMGLDEPGPRGFDDVGEMLDRSPYLRTRVAYHSESDAIPVARVNGVTSVAVVQTGGEFGGEVPVMNLAGWTWEEATLAPNVGIQFTFPPLVVGGGRGGFGGGRGGPPPDRAFEDIKKERDRKLDDVVRLFEQARAYAKAGPNRTTDWMLESLVPVVERKLPLITTVNREEDIRDAVAFAERARVDLVIAGGAEASYVAALLKERNIPVILGERLTLPARQDDFHASSYQLAGELVKAGVRVAFSSGNNTNVRLLPYNAAISVAWGMPREAALEALTIRAAEILGVADRVGSLEPGKDANFFIAKGDPLEIRTPITHVFIQGQAVDLGNKHQSLYERYINRP